LKKENTRKGKLMIIVSSLNKNKNKNMN